MSALGGLLKLAAIGGGVVLGSKVIAKKKPRPTRPHNVGDPITPADHMHLAQLAAREHVSPHVRRAARVAQDNGDRERARELVIFAGIVDGEHDERIAAAARAAIRIIVGTDSLDEPAAVLCCVCGEPIPSEHGRRFLPDGRQHHQTCRPPEGSR